MKITTQYVKQILEDTDYIRYGGTPEELKTAEYLKMRCAEAGVDAYLEPFEVQKAEIHEVHLYANGIEIPCKAYKNSGCADLEAPFYYLANTDQTSLMQVKGKIVLLDRGGVPYFLYQDLLKNGAAGFITYTGDANYPDDDIDQKELRAYVSFGNKIPGVNINAKQALKLVEMNPDTLHMVIDQTESQGESRNLIAEIPGTSDEWIVFTAHYDSTMLSHGAYDNMTGCIGLLGIMKELAENAPYRYGMRFIFCGSEERGLLGSKAYVAAHEAELEKIALNINLDMIGSTMGYFLACCTCEQKLADYIGYMAAEAGWGIRSYQGVYSSDSTPFADKSVPAVSFARMANKSLISIHNRYDTLKVVNPEQFVKDLEFILSFTKRMVNAFHCPVSREIPENVKNDLDIYLNRKRRNQ